jgi:hypothetical protein
VVGAGAAFVAQRPGVDAGVVLKILQHTHSPFQKQGGPGRVVGKLSAADSPEMFMPVHTVYDKAFSVEFNYTVFHLNQFKSCVAAFYVKNIALRVKQCNNDLI